MGQFITFEGGEGSGKSTQARALYRHLLHLHIPALLTHEPGGTALGISLRRWLKGKDSIDATTELLLFNASRAHLVSKVIEPALEKGTIVVCDRFTESTIAYQGYGRGLNLDLVQAVNNVATKGLRPNLIVFLDIPPDRGLARKGLPDRFEREDIGFHRRVRSGYLEMANKDPQRWLVIDGSMVKSHIESIVWERIEPLLKCP